MRGGYGRSGFGLKATNGQGMPRGSSTSLDPRRGRGNNRRGRFGHRLSASESSMSRVITSNLAGTGAANDAEVAWTPSQAYLDRSRLRRFMARHDIATYDDLLARATADPAWYWEAVAEDLDSHLEPPLRAGARSLSRRALGGVVHRRRFQLRHQRPRPACGRTRTASASR